MTEDDTFAALKSLSFEEMYQVLLVTREKYRGDFTTYGYLTAELESINMVAERNKLLRRYGWTHKDFLDRLFNPGI